MKITELQPDTKNANRGTKRGRKAVEDSLSLYGAGRSILIDKAGRVIAGNQTLAAASSAGITEVILVPSDGKSIIAVQRTDLSLDSPEGRALAIADNRTSEVGLEWNPEILGQFVNDLDLKPFFTGDELTTLIAPSLDNLTPSDYSASAVPTPEGRYKSQFGVIVICGGEAEQQKLYERLTADGLDCRVVVT